MGEIEEGEEIEEPMVTSGTGATLDSLDAAASHQNAHDLLYLV
jgi:hypothetical protein